MSTISIKTLVIIAYFICIGEIKPLWIALSGPILLLLSVPLIPSPTSIKMLKFAMNLTDDGMVGQQVFAGEATRLAYMTDEAKEGRDAFLEKRPPNFNKKWIP